MKPRGAGQADVAEGEHHEERRVNRHAIDEAAEHVDLVRMHAVVDDADAEEEAGRDDAVRQHLEDRAFDALRREGEDAERHEAHVSDRRIGDQLLEVGLRQGDERGVDDGDDRQREDERRQLLAGDGEHRHREAQEAVAAHLQAGSPPGRRSRQSAPRRARPATMCAPATSAASPRTRRRRRATATTACRPGTWSSSASGCRSCRRASTWPERRAASAPSRAACRGRT